MNRPEPRGGLAHRLIVYLRPARETRGRRPARPGAEALEARALLSVASGITGVWAASEPVDPSSAVLVKFSAGVSAAARQAELDAVGGRVVTAYPDGPSLVAIPPWADRTAALDALRAAAGVSYAEADAVIHSEAASVSPNDPKYAQQWGLGLIDAPQAWGVSTGSSSVIVAILDTGIDLKNADFAGRLWVNTAKSTRFKTVYGWNFAGNNGNTQDDNGHGTHVAGIVAATGNNAAGVAGVDWGARIMPVKTLDRNGDGSTDKAVAGVYFAVNNGAKVINASWGGDVWSQAMSDAISYANARGVVFVTAAGNEASNNDVNTTFPASFRTPNELVVAAVDSSGHLADYSNYGVTTVDLAAPGSGIISTIPGGFANYSGTSMATPYVTGTVSLLAAKFPTLSAAQLVSKVLASVKPMAGLNGLVASGGVVDPYYALTGRVGTSTTTTTPGGSAATSFTGIENLLLSTDTVYAAAGGTPERYVNYAYQAVLGRAAGPAEVTAFSGLLRNGLSRSTFVSALETIDEARATRVARWYVQQVGWSISVPEAKANAGVQFWAGALAAGQSDGTVQASILGSDAYYSAVGGTASSFVSALSLALFGRAADATLLSATTTQLAGGMSRSDVVREFLAEPEARTTAIARLYQDELGATATLAQLKASSYIQGLAGSLTLA